MPTSMIMRRHPQLLNQEVDIAELNPALPTAEQFTAASQDGRWRQLSPLGHIGDPSVAAPGNGDLYPLEAGDMAAAIAQLLCSGEWSFKKSLLLRLALGCLRVSAFA